MDNKSKGKLIDALVVIITTTHGLVGVAGFVLIGAGIYLYSYSVLKDVIFTYVILGLGTLFVLISIILAVIKAIKAEEKEFILTNAEYKFRQKQANLENPDETLVEFRNRKDRETRGNQWEY